MASVYEKQNEPEMQMLLCAQRKEYSRVKTGEKWLFVISVVVVTSFTLWVAFTDDPDIMSTLTVLNTVIIFSREKIKDYFDGKQEFAAKIQQYFDSCCYNEVYGKKIIDGQLLFSNSEIAEIQAKVKNDDLSAFVDWYPDYRNRSPEEQILYSQRENLSWDYKLRSFYKNTVIAILLLILFGLIFYGIKSDATVGKMCALTSCFLVIVESAWDCILRNKKDLMRLKKIFQKFKETEIEVCANKRGIQKKLSDLQNMIFAHRKECFLIPDFVYNLRKKRYQEIADATAEQLNC